MHINIPFSITDFEGAYRLLLQTQQTTPDTRNYMIAGFVVIFGTILLYLASLAIRWRNLNGDLEVLHELEKRQVTPLSSASQAEKARLSN
jgi:hypothetical protein